MKPNLADLAQQNAEIALRDFIRSKSDTALEVWLRDALCGTSSMGNNLRYARGDAAALRAKADEIENRAVYRLADDICAEWISEEILKAISK